VNHVPNVGFGKILFGACSHFWKAIPFIHSKLSDSNFNIEPAIVLLWDSPLRELGIQHIDMCVLTVLNLRYQAPSRLGKIANTAPNKAFPPLMLLVVCASRPFPRPNANKNADVPAWPFIYGGFFQYLWARIVFSSSFIMKPTLTNLDCFKCKPCSGGSAPSLPNCTIRYYGRLFPGIIGA
jgi:hypothetical protein